MGSDRRPPRGLSVWTHTKAKMARYPSTSSLTHLATIVQVAAGNGEEKGREGRPLSARKRGQLLPRETWRCALSGRKRGQLLPRETWRCALGCTPMLCLGVLSMLAHGPLATAGTSQRVGARHSHESAWRHSAR